MIAVLGQSGVGKTSFVVRNFIRNPVLFLEPIKHTRCDDLILLGDYVSDIRTKGTDTLPYNSIDKIIRFILDNSDKTIVAEGQRITNRRFFSSLVLYNIPFEIILLTCPLQVSIERLRSCNSQITEKFVKTTKTAALSIFSEFYKYSVSYKVIENYGTP